MSHLPLYKINLTNMKTIVNTQQILNMKHDTLVMGKKTFEAK